MAAGTSPVMGFEFAHVSVSGEEVTTYFVAAFIGLSESGEKLPAKAS